MFSTTSSSCKPPHTNTSLFWSKSVVLAVWVLSLPPPSPRKTRKFVCVVARYVVFPYRNCVLGCQPFKPGFQSSLKAICLSRRHQFILGCKMYDPYQLYMWILLFRMISAVVQKKIHLLPSISSNIHATLFIKCKYISLPITCNTRLLSNSDPFDLIGFRWWPIANTNIVFLISLHQPLFDNNTDAFYVRGWECPLLGPMEP